MAEVLGIVAGFLGPGIELGKSIAKPIKRQFNYLRHFNINIQNLRDEARKLEEARASLQMRVDADENNAQVIVTQVKTWLESVKKMQAKMTETETEITTTQDGGLTVKSRFSLSKKVKKMAEAMKELLKSCNFNIVSQPPPPAALVPVPLGLTYDFESRKHIEEDIMLSFRGNKANMLGICGMGGVGKTTMAKRVMHRVREEHLFEEIVMVVVSQKVDLLRIQDDLAKSLGLNLGEGSLSSKAHTLRTRLTAGRKRTLIVLDDAWEYLKLEDLGIPCKSECRVLLTSRDSNIFKRMNVEKVYAVRVLSESEAWCLFKSTVGSCIDHQNVVSVAQRVVQECQGLPIALVTVGAAIKDIKNTYVWEDALQQLKSSNPIDMPEVLDGVYRPLRLSYEFMKSERVKSLFLLCCLFPEDHNISHEELVVYAMGLRMFEEITNLEQTRNKVCSLVEMLKSRFLLLEGDSKNHVRMHDVVRDVAIFIAKDEKRINSSDCTWFSTFMGGRTKIPVGSNFPNIRLLSVDLSIDENSEIYDGIFEGMRELNVFSITCSFQQLSYSTNLLKNLRTLILLFCTELEDISVVGELVNLEILICRSCYAIEILPVELGRLRHLRLLEISSCWNLNTIPPGIISNLVGLEELIVKDFDKWEASVLSELQASSSLTRLEIEMKDSRLADEETCISPNIMKYGIVIGGRRSRKRDHNAEFYSMEFERKMELKLRRDINFGNWFQKYVRSVEYMYLKGDGSRNLDLVLAQNLKWLTFRSCSTVKKLVNNYTMTTTSATVTAFPLLEVLQLEKLTKLEEICDIDTIPSNSFENLRELRLESLQALKRLWKISSAPNRKKIAVSICSNLSSIYIAECHSLSTLFSSSMMARGSCLVQLERLEIYGCYMMEQLLLWNEKENQRNTHITLFPKLKFLSLDSMPRLTTLCKGIESLEFPLLAEMKIDSCPLLESLASTTSSTGIHGDDSQHLFCKQEVKFGSLKKLEITSESWCGRQISLNLLSGLSEFHAWGLDRIKSIFSSSTARNLLCIRRLSIRRCRDMVRVIGNEGEGEDACSGETPLIRLFPNLEALKLMNLPKLISFCEWRCALELPSLKSLYISDCNLMYEFTRGPLIITPNLEELQIGGNDLSGKDVHTALQLCRVKAAAEKNSGEMRGGE